MLDALKHQNELIDNGYTIIDTSFLNDELNAIRKEFYYVNSIFYKNLCGNEIHGDDDMIAFHKSYQADQFNVWKVFQFSPTMYAIGGNTQLIKILSDMGITKPTLDLPPQLRCDMPVENQSIFKSHQDFAYNLGSDDSVTTWTPLQDTAAKEGCLLVVPGSHTKGIYEHDNGIISEKYDFDFKLAEVKFGQTLIFNQKLVHQSGFNTSDKIRFSMQLRYSNLASTEYMDRKWYKNHKTVLQQYA